MAKFNVELVAYTRQTFAATVEVPSGESLSDEEILRLLTDEVAAGYYDEDHEYWEQGEGRVEPLEDDDNDEFDFQIVRDGSQLRMRAMEYYAEKQSGEERSEE